MIPRVYIDTSAIGGYLDEEFAPHSGRLFTGFEADRLKAVVSNISIAELLQAPEAVAPFWGILPWNPRSGCSWSRKP